MFFKKKEKFQAPQFTDQNFETEVLSSDKGALIDFWAPWCGPCRVMTPIVNELAEEFGDKVIIGKVNVDENPNLSQAFKVKSIPTLVFIKNRQLIERFNGLVPKPNLHEMVEDLINYTPEEEE